MSHNCTICGKEFEKGYRNSIAGVEAYACGDACVAKAVDGAFEKGRPLQSWSRVTGYLQSVDGWNPGKVAELRDRHRDNHYFEERRAI